MRLVILTVFCLFLLVMESIFVSSMSVKAAKHIDKVVLSLAVDKTDMRFVAAIINAECSICSEEEKIKIAEVVVNRARKEKKTIEEIIKAEGQFLGANSPNFVPLSHNEKIALSVLSKRIIDHQYLYFFQPDPKGINPTWTKHLEVDTFENHYHRFAK